MEKPMTESTPSLDLPYIMAAQAQKHATHNEAIRALDCVVHLSVVRSDASTPPATPADGDRYLVATPGDGAWGGRGGQIAAWARQCLELLRAPDQLDCLGTCPARGKCAQ
jgi:hypothetical protein